MNWQIIIRPKAEEDLQLAKLWYESKKRGLGDGFIDSIRHAIRFLEKDPTRQPLYYREFRRLMTSRFPYKIFYFVEGNRVIVFRILHSKMDYPRHLLELTLHH